MKILRFFKAILCLIFGSYMFLGMCSAANKMGFLLGVDVGGVVGALSNNDFAVNVSKNATNTTVPSKETVQVNAGFGLNARMGGYGYFDGENGMRAYLSIGGTFGAPSFAFGDLKAVGITLVTDVNVDYLRDTSINEAMTFGYYIGISTGYLMTFYPGGSALTIVNIDIPQFRGITSGFNLGLRVVVNKHNQFEFSTKTIFTNSMASENIFGFQVFVGANYSYIFNSF